jgi:hypothetical protein
MLSRIIKLFFLISLIAGPLVSEAQTPYKNEAGQYFITPLTGWVVTADGNVTNVYAPDESAMDTWSEKLEVSTGEANDVNLNDAFNYYIKKEFPEAYNKFEVISQGDESINGLKAKWAVFLFTASGTAGSGTENETAMSAPLQAIFYLLEKNNTLYFLVGVTEKSYFSTYEQSFRTITRSFRLP